MTDSQTKASRKWEEKNKVRANYIRYQSSTKSFILNHATNEDLDVMEQYIQQRREKLRETLS